MEVDLFLDCFMYGRLKMAGVCVCGGGEEMDGRGLSALMNTKSDL